VKIERCALQFFFAHVLERAWPWVDMLKPPVVRSLPDVLSVEEIARIILVSRERRYQTFWLTTCSLGLRLGEALHLRVGDIDSARAHVHVHSGTLLRRGHSEFDTQASENLQHGVVSRFGARSDCLVQALATQARALGDRADSARFGHVANSSEKYVGVLALERRRQVLRDQLFVVEKGAGIKLGDFNHSRRP
jgi:integrase